MRSRLPGRLAVAAAALAAGCSGTEPLAPGVTPMGALSTGPQLAAPTNVTVTLGTDGAIVVAWQDNSGNESRFDVFRSNGHPVYGFSLHGSAPANATTYRDAAVASPYDYCYQVRATRERGNSFSASPLSASVCVLPVMVAPSNVTAVATSESTIAVGWQDNTGDETGFEVYRGTQTGIFALVARTGSNVTSVEDTGLAPNTTHCYHVRAFRGTANFTEFAPAPCAQTPPAVPRPPDPAFGTTAVPTHSTGVRVQWHGGSVASDGYTRVDRSFDGGATWAVLATLRGVADGLVQDDGLQSERAVCYRVVNYNDAGPAAPSNTACTTPPAAPTGLTMTAVDDSTVDLAWRDNSGVEDGYEVRMTFESCWGDWDGSQYCDWEEAVVAILPAGATSHRATSKYALAWVVLATKDGGYSTAASVLP